MSERLSVWAGCAAEVKGRSLRVNRESVEKGIFPSSKSEAREENPIEAFVVVREAFSPNQTPEPTALLVTPRACARVAPIRAVAHL
jgi:hypothetical protein